MHRYLVCVLCCLPILAGAQSFDRKFPKLELQLDGALTEISPATDDTNPGTLLLFGRSDLQRRLLQSRQRTQLLKLENVHVEREIAINESLIQRLQQLSDSRGQTTLVVRDVIQARATPRALETPQALAPAAVPAPQVKIVRLAVGALALNDALIPGLKDWVLITGLFVAILLLLGWILRLRVYNRATLAVQTRPGSAVQRFDRAAGTGPPSLPQAQPERSPAAIPAAPRHSIEPASSVAPEPKATTPDMTRTRQTVSRDLKEIDTLIAFEQYNQALEKLQLLIDNDPENPEYLLRNYHLRSMDDADADDEALLRALMDGPLSDTLLRVKAMGKSMMPGDPLFDDEASRDAARRVMSEATQAGTRTQDMEAPAADFNSTMILAPNAGKKSTNPETGEPGVS